MGEMALQGPHQVAKQSTRTALSVVETRSLNSLVLSQNVSLAEYRVIILFLQTHVLISCTANLAAELWKGRATKGTAPERAAWAMGRMRRKGEAIL
jgi:hypothetical protein